ncbi:hatching enzyme 1.2-like isoform X2 [Physella acuta]|uniref:hatching enzyme 1.2-like isoform X2 n=1 Tax=Physella acuta TaxID=109671 RepID=UPI0027DAD4E5|nr:hatching enzyme 1.2-like isoform X2 [Physella acuta]
MVTMATCLGALIVLVLMTSVSSIPIATGEDGTLNPPIVVQYLTPPEGQREQLTSDDVLEKVHRNAVSNKTRRWANGIVPYTISREFPTAIQLTIREAMDEIEADAANGSTKCVQFVPRSTEPRYLQINTGSGCHSTIGYDETEELSSTLGAGCEQKGIIMHELLHVLGFYHEQNRPDRDLYVNINETNVALIRDFYIRNSSVIDTLGTPYDFASIMHYNPYTASKDHAYPVLTPKPQFAHGVRLGQRVALTELDVIKLQRLYECVEDTSHIHSDLQGAVIQSCDFGDGLCDFFSHPSQPFDPSQPTWVVRSGQVEDGPKAGFTNGLDPYLTVSPSVSCASSNCTASVHTSLSRTPDSGQICVSLQVYQKGPSYLALYIHGPGLPRTLVVSLKDKFGDHWARADLDISIPPALDFQLEFKATLQQGSVSVDDFFLLHSRCLYIS